MLRRNFLRFVAGGMAAGSIIDLVAGEQNVGRSQFISYTVVYLKESHTIIANKRFVQLKSGDCMCFYLDDKGNITEKQHIMLRKADRQMDMAEFAEYCQKQFKGYNLEYFQIYSKDLTRTNVFAVIDYGRPTSISN
jgi:hypothetical protein